MTRHRSIILLLASLLTISAVFVAWAWWPEGTGRADLAEIAPQASIPLSPAPSAPSTFPPSTPTTAAPSTPTTAAPNTPATVEPLLTPRRLLIPAIGVDASIVPVGQTPDGAMEIPQAAEVGWYRLGPSPGAPGSAVLAGHIDFNGERGAFFTLGSVAVGAEIIVDGEGTARRFVVTGREQIPKAEVDLGRYFTHDGPNRMTLITCGGGFDRGAGHYTDNIVITATLQPA